MKINNISIKAKRFAYDECHKIYLIESKKEEMEALRTGYMVYPIDELENAYELSCSLRFISNWKLNKTYVKQFDEATFTGEDK